LNSEKATTLTLDNNAKEPIVNCECGTEFDHIACDCGAIVQAKFFRQATPALLQNLYATKLLVKVN